MSESIYEMIKSNVAENGSLSQSFRLPDEDPEGKVKFAPGAMDGISIYHMGANPLKDDEKEELFSILKDIAAGNDVKADLSEYLKKHRVIRIIDDIQRMIIDNKDAFDASTFYHFAEELVLSADRIELVKFGMVVLELFNTAGNKALSQAIRTVGLSDEFTIFSVFIMRTWSDGNSEILELAKKVRGWGRVHCVDFIEPESDEIKEWLLLNGVDNDVVPAYSGLRVFEKADVQKVLDKPDLSYAELSAILKITDALLDEGPVRGISMLDAPEEYLNEVLQKAGNGYALTKDEEDILESIRKWIEEYKGQ